ncbi:12086_t:CDS:10, partial [Acaulospora colombiana]
SQEIEPSLRRSTRHRRVVNQQGYIPTVEAVPLRGDIPLRDVSSPKRSYQFSLPSLLREKKQREKSGYNIQALELAIQDNMLDEVMEDPFDYNRSEISASIWEENTKFEHLQQIFEEDDMMDPDHYVEFFENSSKLDSHRPSLRTPRMAKNSAFLLISLAVSDDERLRDILCSHWIPQQYEMGLDLSPQVIAWLLQLVAFEQDAVIVEGASQNLKRLTEISVNVDCCQIRRAIIVILRLSLDSRLTSISGEVEKVIDSLLQSIHEDDWNSQVKLVCEDIISTCRNDTQFKVAILENLPASSRGRLVRRLLSFYSLFSSVDSSNFSFAKIDVSKPLNLDLLLDLFSDEVTIFKIRGDTNYKELYHNVIILGYTLDDSIQMSSEKDVVEIIIRNLRNLHGKIVDMRAAFMDRTKRTDHKNMSARYLYKNTEIPLESFTSIGDPVEHKLPAESFLGDFDSEAVVDELATQGSVYHSETDQACYIAWRVIESGCVLELRRFLIPSQGATINQPGASSLPVRFRFSAAILPHVTFFTDPATRVLRCIVLISCGVLYRLDLPLGTLFTKNLPPNFYRRFKVMLLQGKTPFMVHAVDYDNIVISSKEGTIIYLKHQPMPHFNALGAIEHTNE